MVVVLRPDVVREGGCGEEDVDLTILLRMEG